MVTQVNIADVEAMTGLTFPVLHDHDHFAEGGTPGRLEIDRGGAGLPPINRPVRPIMSNIQTGPKPQ